MHGWREPETPLHSVDGPTTNWLGPETVVKLVVEGCEVNTLADSGSQVNTMTPEFVTQNGWPVLPLEDLVDHPLHPVGLGGNWTWPLGFVILRVQVKEIVGYDEDVIFLIVPDGSEFSKRVPLVIGACMLSRVVNVIKESELDMLLPPWAVVCASRFLSVRRGTATSDNESIGDISNPEPYVSAPEPETDIPVYIREGVRVEAFQTQIPECKVDPLQEESVEVMVIPVRSGGLQGAKIKLLPPGLQVPYMFTVQKRGSGKVSIVVRNVQITHLLQEGRPGRPFGACYACTTKRAYIGVRGSDSSGGHCRTPLHGGTAGEAS